MSYIGSTPTTQSFTSGTDYFNGTGSQTAFTLSRTVNSINDIEVVVNNVEQQPNTSYTISGTTLTFTAAPSSGTQNIYVRYLSTITTALAPSQNTVQYSSLNSDNQSKLGIQYKNRIINSAMVIDQRNAGASVTPANATTTYITDRFALYESTSGTITGQQVVDAPTGFINSLKVTVTSSATPAANELTIARQAIEGYNTADLGWGTANAKTVTLSFWVKSSLTGQFGGSFVNANVDRSYPFTYTISSASTWEQKTITVAGDTTGTWGTTNGVGIYVFFDLGTNADRLGTANTWAAADYRGATGDTKLISTNSATWQLTGVQLEVGTQATQFTTAGGSYGAELALCQRYYAALATPIYYQGFASGAASVAGMIYFPVSMRAAPTIGGTLTGSNSSSQSTSNISVLGAQITTNTSSSNNTSVTLTGGTASAEL